MNRLAELEAELSVEAIVVVRARFEIDGAVLGVSLGDRLASVEFDGSRFGVCAVRICDLDMSKGMGLETRGTLNELGACLILRGTAQG